MPSNNIYTPYTYLIGWTSLNKFYYGVRFAKGCSPDDLWSKYFTSSAYVKQIREEFGEPDIIQVRRTFQDSESALRWEHKVLQKMRVRKSEKWLNKSDGKCQGPNITNNLFKSKESQIILQEKSKAAIKKDKIENPDKWREIKRRQSENGIGKQMAAKNNSVVDCPHCGKFGQYRIMKRWHFDNCSKPNVLRKDPKTGRFLPKIDPLD